MPWDARRVDGLWRTRGDVLDHRTNYLKKYLVAFANVATLFEHAGAQIDDMTMALSISNCNDSDNPVQIRDTFIDELESSTRVQRPPAAAAVPFVVVTPAPIVAQLHRLAGMRTPQKAQRGMILARKAMELLGQWRWVQRTPDTILPYRHEFKDPKQPYRFERKGVRPPEPENARRHTDINAFDRWLQSGGPAPLGPTALNCRDAVLVTAVEAGLLSLGQLRATYRAAETAARKILDPMLLDLHRTAREDWSPKQWQQGADAHRVYTEKVDQSLIAYRSVVPVNLQYGLIPRPGDLVFVNDPPTATAPAHVCVSLGRRQMGGRWVDEVASLWHHNNGTFTRAPLFDMVRPGRSSLVYTPCPF